MKYERQGDSCIHKVYAACLGRAHVPGVSERRAVHLGMGSHCTSLNPGRATAHQMPYGLAPLESNQTKVTLKSHSGCGLSSQQDRVLTEALPSHDKALVP